VSAPHRTLRYATKSTLLTAIFSVGLLVFSSSCALRICPPSIEEDGQHLYLSACASCHGVTGTGDGPVAVEIKTQTPDLTRLGREHGGRFPRDFVVETIAGERNFTAHGTREMPVWSQRFGTGGSGAPGVASVYARRNLELLTNYIESIQRTEK
jgi:mono/diheme cytochrome c family protein